MAPKRNRKYQKKKLPMARKAVDQKQNKAIDNMAKKIKVLQGEIEVKHIDTLISAVPLLATPTATQTILLNGLSQGTSNITRIGDLAKMTSIQFRGQVKTTAAHLGSSIFRLIIFWDKQPNGAAPVYTNLLDVSVIGQVRNAPYNHDYLERFDVIWDKTFVLDANTITDFDPATGTTSTLLERTLNLSKFKKLTRQTNYGLGNAGTVADISHNSLYLLLISNTSGNDPTITMGVRVNYRDI